MCKFGLISKGRATASLRRATYFCPSDDLRLSIVAVDGFHPFEAWV
jgi:hypothetical protein